MTSRHVVRATVPVLAAAGVVQWWVGQPPLLAVVASYVAVLLLVARALPTRIAVSAAFLGQMGSYLALLVVAPLVLDGALRPGVTLGILLAPCACLLGALRPSPDTGRETSSPPWLMLGAAALGAVVVVAAVMLAEHGNPYGAVAWTGSGDARNHLMDARGILAEGGLHGRWLGEVPMLQEGLMALLLQTHGRGSLGPAELLRHDLYGYAQVSTALVVVWTLSVPALLAGLGRLRGRAAAVAVAAASLVPLTGLALGVAMRDGFVPILLLQPLLLCSLAVLAWLSVGRQESGTPVTIAVGVTAVALPLAATTWTPYFAVLGTACVIPWLWAVRSGTHRGLRLLLIASGALAGSAVCLSVVARRGGGVVLAGAITPPSPVIALLLPLAVLVMVVAGWSSVRPLAFVPYLAGSVGVLAIVVYSVAVQPPGLAWNYYPAKVAWIWAAVSLPLLLVPFAHARRGGLPLSRPRRAVTVTVGSAAVLLAGVGLTPVGTPVLPSALSWTPTGGEPSATIGTWSQPDAASLQLVVRLGDPSKRYAVYNVDPGQDRLTNFWLAVYDHPYDGEFYTWAYDDGGQPADVCELLELQPERVVVTADPTAEDQLSDACGRPVKVMLVPGPSEQQG